jgi:hypothetical protein
MAERLATLPAMQVDWVQFPVPARPTFSVEKWILLPLLCYVRDRATKTKEAVGRRCHRRKQERNSQNDKQ